MSTFSFLEWTTTTRTIDTTTITNIAANRANKINFFLRGIRTFQRIMMGIDKTS